MLERRKNKRVEAKLMITTVYRDEIGETVTEDSLFCEDVGGGGARVAFPRELPKGKILDLKLFLFSDPINLATKGKVVWSNKNKSLKLTSNKGKDGDFYWVGIEFINIDSFTQERILRWVKKEFSI